MFFWLGCAAPLVGVLDHERVEVVALGTTYTVGSYVRDDAPRGEGAPWLLVLDGDVLLERAAAQLDREVAAGRAEPLVLVGVGNQATRECDYTPPTELEEIPEGGCAGGIAPFFDWVVGELVPEREAALDVGGDHGARRLTGHSYGGLATTWALYHHNDVWSGYGVVSPSLWWDRGQPFSWEDDSGPLDGRVHLNIGSVEGLPMNALFEAFSAELAARGDLHVSDRVFEGYDHYAVLERAFADVIVELGDAP